MKTIQNARKAARELTVLATELTLLAFACDGLWKAIHMLIS